MRSSDAEALQRLGARLARRRLARNQSQAELAEEAGVSRATVQRLEADQSTQLMNFVRVLRALGLPGPEALVPEPGVRPLEELQRRGRPRRRASRKADADADDATSDAPWTWGPEAGGPDA